MWAEASAALTAAMRQRDLQLLHCALRGNRINIRQFLRCLPAAGLRSLELKCSWAGKRDDILAP
jgi:hypothetical protein